MTRYRHRAGELLVHADDCAALRPALAGFGYHPAGVSGSVHRFTGTRPVPEVLAALGSRGASPNHLFGPDRIIWGDPGMRPKPTHGELTPLSRSDEDPTVGVIDTGILLDRGCPHPYLANRVVFDQEDVVRLERGEDGNPVGSAAHGTFVAGVLLKQVPAEVGVRVRMKGVLDRADGAAEDLAVATAIDELREEGITLINLSFSGATWEDEPPKAIEAALRRLPPETVVVASAGNRSSRRRVYPAAIKFEAARPREVDQNHAWVIAVGAADSTQDSATPRVADFSNYGPWVSAYAEGVDVLGPYFRLGYPTEPAGFNGYAVWSGTSFSAAIVTGKIAAGLAKAGSARAAAEAVLRPLGVAKPPTVCVQDVNGPDHVSYVAGVREPGV
ncbi:S8/S53 family peptidase [Amycolatopsis sp. SID8362]|uniref:S8 family peptidase n=1 Tax=Amycolatopsis sp. SID8362 TaxID=2690346 RepID=UPI00136EFF64|nr:S8/S53 family peptidase [Amycolatopsis sp. SID8362]NBH08796.1 S8 family serine peptidase [Amycolatopsis sp. SID8362]NED45489.1 S8/S53 family peptidase [Amycolatopsis sp. SID8362]